MTQKQLSIGGISVLLRAAEPRFWELADQRYANFYTSGEAAPDEVIDFSVVDREDGSVSERAMTSVEITGDSGIMRMARGQGRAEWDRDQHHCPHPGLGSEFFLGRAKTRLCSGFRASGYLVIPVTG